MPRVIHTAQALVDVVIRVPGLPVPGGNVMAPAAERHAAGAVTILLAAARSDARAVLAGSVGEGPNADLIRAALAAEGVEICSPPVRGLDTGICVVLVDPQAQRTFVTTRGAERQIDLASLATSRPEAGDLVCISGYSLFDPTREPLLAWLGTLPAGVEVVLDPGDAFAELDAATREAAMAACTVWTSNAAEASAVTGVGDPAGAARACRDRLPPGAVAIVRDGARGCTVIADGREAAIPARQQRAIDTNGAGDTHTGTLLAARAGGLDWFAAARRANAAAAIKVTRRGPDTAPTAAQIDAFLARAETRVGTVG